MNTHNIFPDIITSFPEANIPLEGVTAWLGQGNTFQVVFLSFDRDTHVPEHSHGEQWEIVLEGMVDVTMNGKETRYRKGDRFFVPDGVPHKAFVHKGFHSIAIFNQTDRYQAK